MFTGTLFFGTLHSQTVIEWTNHTAYSNITCLLETNTALLAGTNGGIVVIDTSSIQVQFYNKSISGLPTNGVNCLEKDPAGTIWIGTKCGLTQWQGNSWFTFTPQNSILTVSNVSALKYSSVHKALFAGLEDGNVLKIDSNNWSYLVDTIGNKPQSPITDIESEPDGNIWAGTRSTGVYLFDGMVWQVFNSSNTSMSDFIRSIAVDHNGIVWVANPIILWSFDGNNWTSHISGPYINGGLGYMTVDSSNNLWISSLNGLKKFDGNSWSYYQGNNLFTSLKVNCHLLHDPQHLWVAIYHNGLERVDGSTISHLPLEKGLISQEICDIDFDPIGHTTWVAVKWQGKLVYASFFNDTVWDHLTALNSPLATAIVSSIAIDTNATLYIGTTDQGLYIRQGNAWSHYTMSNSGLCSDQITTVCIDKNQNLLIGSLTGNVQLLHNQLFFNLIQSPLIHNKINHFEPVNSNAFWVSTDSAGLVWCDYNSFLVYNTGNSGLPSDHVEQSRTDTDGTLWIATDQGVATYDGMNWVIYNTLNSGLPDNQTTCITFAPDSSVWIGTIHAGVAVKDGATWSNFRECETEVSSDYILAMATGPDGRIYIGTTHGLNIVTVDNITMVPTNTSPQVNVFPNPSTGQVTITVRGAETETVTMDFFNSLGGCILHEALELHTDSDGLQNVELNIKALSPGLYFYRISRQESIHNGKLLLVK